MSSDHAHSALHAAIAILVLVLISMPCSAGVISAPAPVNPASERDVMLTILARRALMLDAELGRLNIGVRVRNRVATLWGPVPSAELALRAEQRLHGLLDLLAVRSELIVVPGNALAVAGQSASSLPPAPPPALPPLPRDMPAPPPLPPAPMIGAPTPVIDELDLPPRRLPQAK
jgi:hypothetical protein